MIEEKKLEDINQSNEDVWYQLYLFVKAEIVGDYNFDKDNFIEEAKKIFHIELVHS